MHHRVSLGILAIALGLIWAAPAVGQSTTTDVKKKAVDATEAIKNYSVDKKNDAVAHAKKLMSDFNVKTKELEAKASSATGDAKVKSQQALKELKAAQAKAGKKVDELGKASAQSWDSAKGGFADAYKDVQKAYDKAVASLK